MRKPRSPKPDQPDSIFYKIAKWRTAAQEYCPPLTSTELAVLNAMIDHADDRGDNIYPSVPRLARLARRDEKSARNTRKRLVTLGLLVDTGRLQRLRRSDGQYYFDTVYRLGDSLLAPLRGGVLKPDLSHLTSREDTPSSAGEGVGCREGVAPARYNTREGTTPARSCARPGVTPARDNARGDMASELGGHHSPLTDLEPAQEGVA